MAQKDSSIPCLIFSDLKGMKITMEKICLYEPSIASNNLGDEVIVQGCKNALQEFLENNYVIEFSTHTPLSNRYSFFLGAPDIKIVCGSNILTGELNQIRHVKQWAINYATAWQLTNAIFMGVGAQKYQHCNLYTRNVYRKMFNPNYIHSVRDAYTEEFLRKIGINNVVNTGCPTMWGLTPEHCKMIPHNKSNYAVLTLTDYSKNVQRDEYLINTLLEHYKEVFFWVQGFNDLSYFQSLKGSEKIGIISPNLVGYDSFLELCECDFIGTRLHGGMRALQKKRRTIIIGIDNRAIELNRDFNIPVLNQDRITELPELIESEFETKIHLNTENIRKFLSQFEILY